MLLDLYHRLPPPAQSVAASLHGYRLRRQRYGPDLEELVAVVLERERWSADRWRSWQEERLAFVLHRAATKVPYYRTHWAERRRRGDRASCAVLGNWPILEKEALRAAPRAFVADDCDPRRMIADHTSGSTGQPLELWMTRHTVRAWYALVEARCRRWYGVTLHDPWGMLGGQLIVPVQRRRPPFWVWNAGMHQLYLSAYHLAQDLIPAYLDALRRHRATYLLGYPSALHALAAEVLRRGEQELGLRVVVTNAEPLFDHQRRTIAAAFGCAVRETYGMAELVADATECEAGRLHSWPEAGVVEVMDRGTPAGAGEAGELVCTGLVNADMPLVRYRVGDRGALEADDRPCACGRTLPLVQRIEGRVDDVLYMRDGRAVGRLDPVFKASYPLREAQIVQESFERVRVRCVPAAGFGPTHADAIADGIRARLGPIEVVIETVAEIPRGPGGKFHAVICDLSSEDRRRAQAMQVSGGVRI
jgi:phenylacetate-CoA ligase